MKRQRETRAVATSARGRNGGVVRCGPPPLEQQTVTPELRESMIWVAAYLRAERRGFRRSNPMEDWFAAEREVDARLGGAEVAARSRASLNAGEAESAPPPAS